MRQPVRHHPSQLTLSLAPAAEPPLAFIPAEEPMLVQALADLLLAALGQRTPDGPTEAMTMEGGDEPEDHH